MKSLISKDEEIRSSPVYLGYLVLKKLKDKKEKKITLHELAQKMREELGNLNYRQFIFSLLFLYQSGVIDFDEPYIFSK